MRKLSIIAFILFAPAASAQSDGPQDYTTMAGVAEAVSVELLKLPRQEIYNCHEIASVVSELPFEGESKKTAKLAQLFWSNAVFILFEKDPSSTLSLRESSGYTKLLSDVDNNIESIANASGAYLNEHEPECRKKVMAALTLVKNKSNNPTGGGQ